MLQNVFSNRTKDAGKIKLTKLSFFANLVLNNVKFGLKRKIDYVSYYRNNVSTLKRTGMLPKNLQYLFRNLEQFNKPTHVTNNIINNSFVNYSIMEGNDKWAQEDF